MVFLVFFFFFLFLMVVNMNLNRRTLSLTPYPCSSLPCQEPVVGLTIQPSPAISSCLMAMMCSAGPRRGAGEERGSLAAW